MKSKKIRPEKKGGKSEGNRVKKNWGKMWRDVLAQKKGKKKKKPGK